MREKMFKSGLAAMVLLTVFRVSTQTVFEENFEKDLPELNKTGWSVSKDCQIVSGVSRDGKKSLKVVSEKKESILKIFIPVECGKWYKIEAQIKCENVKGSSGASIGYGFCDVNKKHIPGVNGTYLPGFFNTADWSQFKIETTKPIPDNIKYLELVPGIWGTGTVWFDDIKVSEIKEISAINILSPEDNESVSSSMPQFRWEENSKLKIAIKPSNYNMIFISQNPSFPDNETLKELTLVNSFSPKKPLKAGKWFWKLQKTDVSSIYPPYAGIHTFTITEKAAGNIWPPDIKPLWAWSSETKPTLKAYIGPDKVTNIKNIEVSIDGISARLISYKENILTFEPAVELQNNLHEIKITVKSEAKEAFTEENYFCNKKIPNKFKVRKDNILLINEEPFFPIGTYRDPNDTAEDFSGIIEAGFNMTHSYPMANCDIKTIKSYLEKADKNNLKVFLGLKDSLPKDGNYKPVQNRIFELMDSPSLLSWYVPEEPIWRNIKAEHLLELYNKIKIIDPAHPASLLLAEGEFGKHKSSKFAKYPEACDLIWADPYPLPDHSMLQVEDFTKDTVRFGKPAWIVLQGFDWSYCRAYRNKTPPKEIPMRPTPEETRFMAYLALSAGANGLIWYWLPKEYSHMKNQTPIVWKGICDTVQELKSLMPYLVAEKTDKDTVKVGEPFRTWTRKVGDKRILVVLNTSEKSTAKLNLDLSKYDFKEMTHYPDKSKVESKDKIINEGFKPIEVKIYLLEDK